MHRFVPLTIYYIMNMPEIALYNAFSKKVGEKETETLIRFVRSETQNNMEAHARNFLVKQDKVELIEKINTVEVSLTEKINTVEVSLTEKINTVEVSLTEKINTAEITLTEKIRAVETTLAEKINAVEARLVNRLCSSKTELVKWMVALWLSGLALMAGFIKFL